VVVLPIKSEEFFLSGLKVIFKFNMDETQTNTSRNQRVLFALKKPFVFLTFSIMTYQVGIGILNRNKKAS
jgi:hypothetical protein